MEIYIQIVIILNFIVNFLFLIASARFFGIPVNYIRVIVATLINCVYVLLCVWLSELSNGYWRVVSLLLTAVITYGVYPVSLACTGGYLALHGFLVLVAAGLWRNHTASVLAAMVCIPFSVYFLLYNLRRNKLYIPVEISYQGKCLKLTALRDTGNLLVDPLSGNSVIIVCCDIAGELLGLSKQQLMDPSNILAQMHLPGLRLIPYATIGNSGGLLLAMRMDDVRVSGKKGSRVVAFAPENFCVDDSYQVLMGGNVC